MNNQGWISFRPPDWISFRAPETAVDINDETAIAVAGNYSAYRPTAEQLWLVSRRGALAPRLIYESQGPHLSFSLSPDRTHLLVHRAPTELEVLGLAPFRSERRLPSTTLKNREISAVAISNDTKHFAIAEDGCVNCFGGDGQEIDSWRTNGKVRFLTFSGPAVALVGITRDAIIRFGSKGDSATISIPGMRPWGLAADGRCALFLGNREFCEVNVSTGTVAPAISFPGMTYVNCCDPVRRRVASLEWGEVARLRVFQLAD